MNYFLSNRIACLKFRKIILDLCPNLDPFDCCSTIAGLAINLWRWRFLKPNILVNLPENGLRPFCVQSNEARRFFIIYTKLTGQVVQTGDWAKGEYISKGENESGLAGKYRVDGLIHSEDGTQTILEYYGCRYHG